jgi:hypothetical protein
MVQYALRGAHGGKLGEKRPCSYYGDEAMNCRLLAVALGALTCAGCAPGSEGSTAQGVTVGDPVASVPRELTSLAFDHDGTLWIGTKYSGILAFKDGQFRLFDQYNTPMNYAGVSSVLVDANNTKWFVAHPPGAIYSFDNSQWKEIATGEEKIHSLRDDKHGRIWCVAGNRLSYIEQGAFREFKPELSADDMKLWRDGFLSYDIDRHGVVWVALQNASIFRFDGEKGARVFEAASSTYRPGGRMLGGIACDPDSDRLYLWDYKPFSVSNPDEDVRILALENGRFAPINMQLGGTYFPLRWLPGKKLALGVRLQDGAALAEIGGKIEEYSDSTPLAHEDVTDVAIERPGRVWFAGRFGGLRLLDDNKWTTFAPTETVRRRLQWQRTPVKALVEQDAIDVDIHDALQNPRQYANQKIRFKGRVASSFEYAEMLDAKGNQLGIWPEWKPELSQFLAGSQQKSKPHKSPPKTNGDPFDSYLNEPTEYLGFLDWGGDFGHMGGSKNSLTIVEQYPADATQDEKAAIRQAYRKSLDQWASHDDAR